MTATMIGDRTDEIEVDLLRARAFSLVIQGVDDKNGVIELVRLAARNPGTLARAHRRLSAAAQCNPASDHVDRAMSMLAGAWLAAVARQ